MLNRSLAEAIFADKVLLVEGESERLLFEKVLSVVNPFYEANGIYILTVGGVGFKRYLSVLDELNIENVIKTDNDLRSDWVGFSTLGFRRVNAIIVYPMVTQKPAMLRRNASYTKITEQFWMKFEKTMRYFYLVAILKMICRKCWAKYWGWRMSLVCKKQSITTW